MKIMKATELKIGDRVILSGLKTIKHYRGEVPGQAINFGTDISAEVVSTYNNSKKSLMMQACRVRIDSKFQNMFNSSEMDLFHDDEVTIVT